MTKIYHAHLYGSREDKYKILSENTINTTSFTEVKPQKPFYLLIPQDNDLLAEYNQYFKITDVMPINVLGFQTHRDNFALDIDQNSLFERIKELYEYDLTDAELQNKYKLEKWDIAKAREKIRNLPHWKSYLTTCLYRPFDDYHCYYSNIVIDRPRTELINHVFKKNNFCLLLIRQMQDNVIYSHVLMSNIPTVDRVFACSRGAATNFPLYIYPDPNAHKKLQKKRPNFSQDFLKKIEKSLGYSPTPEEIFYYIYAIFHSPTYRTRYAEFLKIDFPRVPITSNKKLFVALSELGEQLVQLHLMTSPKLDKPISKFIQTSDQTVTPGYPKYIEGKVYINKTDYFQNVPETVWNFHIGGYQVCHKWLKDRKGRTLSTEDINHYQKIIVALAETIKLMEKIDKTIPSFPIE